MLSRRSVLVGAMSVAGTAVVPYKGYAEYGKWTPIITTGDGGVYSGIGHYKKVGKIVHIKVQLACDGNLSISGLPHIDTHRHDGG